MPGVLLVSLFPPCNSFTLSASTFRGHRNSSLERSISQPAVRRNFSKSMKASHSCDAVVPNESSVHRRNMRSSLACAEPVSSSPIGSARKSDQRPAAPPSPRPLPPPPPPLPTFLPLSPPASATLPCASSLSAPRPPLPLRRSSPLSPRPASVRPQLPLASLPCGRADPASFEAGRAVIPP